MATGKPLSRDALFKKQVADLKKHHQKAFDDTYGGGRPRDIGNYFDDYAHSFSDGQKSLYAAVCFDLGVKPNPDLLGTKRSAKTGVRKRK